MFPRSVCRTKNRGRAYTIFPRPPNNVIGGDKENGKRMEKGKKETAGKGIDAAE